ncbi:nitroreductase [Alicyclobacillus contaminans]|uniref:nitroreductase family protein n=1 Tax=Alicyclobacillus contaminans TaxID=392016 RepID=UPI00041D8229|nr:nitroreductase family protein [Alicyclobacillus contaminans]GMA51329.1 nitroreductase [Alicyclobacillus contaminans]
MDQLQLAPEIAERKSVTNWTDQKISREAWELLFEAARRAPSSWNHQPARYIAVTTPENIRALSDCLHRTNRWAEHAAGLVVQVACPDDDDRIDGKDYYLYDCGLAMMSLVYQAQILGITARQMIGWDESAVKDCLGIPSEYRVVVITGLGYPSVSPLSTSLAQIKRQATCQHKRYALKHLLSWQRWEDTE